MDAPPLPSDVATLQGMVRELLATVADLRRTVETQQHRIDDLTRRLYGRKSERVTEDTPAAGDAGTKPPSPASNEPPRRRRGYGRRPLPEHLPRERVEYDLGRGREGVPVLRSDAAADRGGDE